MQAVGRLGSYISRGVYTVSDSFHPFGGAVDIVLVQQQDGSFKSSPWYVRFGKFQGVLKAKEKVVSINVNGVEANFHMYLDNKGQAFFLREVEVEEGESIMYPSSSGDERDIQDKKHHLMPKSFSFDSEKSNSMAQVDINKGNVLARTNSDGSMINGLVIGDNNFQREVHNAGIRRLGSLECAEIAANLLEVKWSTNLAGHKPPRKDRPKTRKSKSQHDNTENSSNQRKLYEKAYSRNEQEGLYSNSDLEVARGLSEDTGVCSSCLSTADEVSFTKQKVEVITEVSMSIGTAEDTEHDTKVKEVISDGTRCDLEVACQEIKASNEKRQPSGEDVSGVSIMPGNGIAEEDISPNGVQLLVYRETPESLIGRVDYSSQCNHDVLYPANKTFGPVHAHAEALQATTSMLPEVTKTEEVTMNAEVGVPVMEVCQTSQQTNYPHPGVSNVANIEDQTTLPRTVNLDLGLCSAEKDESNCIAKTSSYSSLGDRALEEKISRVEDVSSTLTSPLPPGDCVLGKSSRPPSPSSEEKLFLSSDHDDSTFKDQFEGSNSSEYVYKEDKHSYSFHLSPESQMTDLGKMSVTSSHTVIPKNKVAGEEDRQLTNSLPSSMHSHSNTLDLHDLCYPLNHLQDSRSPILEQPLLGKDDLKCLKPDDQLLPEEPVVRDNNSSGDAKSTAMNPPFGDSSAPAPSPSGNWRLWPFSFRRSSPETVIVPALDAKDTNASESSVNTDADKNELKPKLLKRNIRANTPTSEQLASLNLKEGRNIVIFTFSTAMLGCQQVDAQIYLWKWNTRIVISDVDGTITKSDVLGQVMPLVGVDWSQTGVTHLFSAIKENGYELLFLSARAISQAYRTRQFLGNLKQDGKVLPGGPVVISPDGLFPSLFREVIRRAPHEFKIACLEDIKALFPPDCNPFYAGFGNRDTDEISYLKVGIPKGKIFIINPKGEVVVNHRHDTKSYTSLHALVNGMFPPTNSFEQEDFNSWNYWKIPPPLIGN